MVDFVSMTWRSYRRNECVYLGRRVRLSPQQTEALAVLLLHRGKPVEPSLLIDALGLTAGRDGNDRAAHVRQLIWKLRARMPGLIDWEWPGYVIPRVEDYLSLKAA